MQHIVPVDFSTFPSNAAMSRVMVGPPTASGIESCQIVCTRVPPGCRGPALHTHAVDKYYCIVTGTMTLQLGTERFVLAPDTMVSIPAGTPHCNWNEGSEPEVHLAIFSPAAAPGSLQNASPRPVPNAKGLIRRLADDGWKLMEKWKTQNLVRRSSGDSGQARLYIAETQIGGGGPSMHFHPFDQFYYILEGSLAVKVGLKRMVAPANSLVVLPAGTLHSNINEGPVPGRHIAMLIPEPTEAGSTDYRVELVKRD